MRRRHMANSIRIASLSIVAFLVLFSQPPAGCASADNARCLMCHSARTLSKTSDGKQISLYVDQEAFGSSTHGKQACVDCHTDLKGQPPKHKRTAAPVQCARCHERVASHPDAIHQNIAPNGQPPECWDCHGSHYVKPKNDQSSPVSPANSESTCAACHSDSKTLDLYVQSVHGAMKEKDVRIAGCADCHPAHTSHGSTDPAVCGQCHPEELEAYAQSAHGTASERGDINAPVCVTCHGGHDVRSPADPKSPSYPTGSPAMCAKCHDDPKLMQAYGLSSDRLKTYRTSYHGIANKYGSVEAAVCVSCHDAHRVLPPDDAKSSVSAARLPETCGRCHPNVGPKVALGSIHLQPSPRKDAGVYWVRTAYAVLISVMMLAFCGYMALDLFTHWRVRRGGRG